MSPDFFCPALPFKELNSLIEPASQVHMVADNHTAQYCLPLVQSAHPVLQGSPVCIIPSGEEHKHPKSLEKVLSHLITHQADRQSIVINVGGGMITDLGGLAASIYKRGINTIHIPTSLLGMVDAAIGGKTGVNFHHIKNVVGSYHQPLAIFTYLGFLDTLPDRELKSGLAEMLKHTLLSGDMKMNEISAFASSDSLAKLGLIRSSALFKESVVESDYREEGRRKILNLGHTVGHALESHSLVSEHPLLHGEAIALGLIAELWLSVRHANLDPAILQQLEESVRQIWDNDLRLPAVDRVHFAEWIGQDKKNAFGNIKPVLLQAPGQPLWDSTLALDDCTESMEYLNSLSWLHD